MHLACRVLPRSNRRERSSSVSARGVEQAQGRQVHAAGPARAAAGARDAGAACARRPCGPGGAARAPARPRRAGPATARPRPAGRRRSGAARARGRGRRLRGATRSKSSSTSSLSASRLVALVELGRQRLRALGRRRTLGVLADDLAAQLLLAARLGVVGPGGAQRPQALAHQPPDPRQEGREGELGAEDDRDEQRGADHDEGPRASEAGPQQLAQGLADGPAGPHGLALVGDDPEGQGQERGSQRRSSSSRPDGLGVGRLDGPAPEQLPARDRQHQRQQHGGGAEQLRDQQLGQEGAEGADEVARRLLAAGLEEGRRVVRVVGGEADQQHERQGEAQQPRELGQARRLVAFARHPSARPP